MQTQFNRANSVWVQGNEMVPAIGGNPKYNRGKVSLHGILVGSGSDEYKPHRSPAFGRVCPVDPNTSASLKRNPSAVGERNLTLETNAADGSRDGCHIPCIKKILLSEFTPYPMNRAVEMTLD